MTSPNSIGWTLPTKASLPIAWVQVAKAKGRPKGRGATLAAFGCPSFAMRISAAPLAGGQAAGRSARPEDLADPPSTVRR
ncbi:hypothetical protein [Paracoccus sp. SY]|uniref:hypothetical protein n=1 Tax=Paracoccus sp. SY TaxID=1330255 RepID=UPI0011AEEB83|nr:hypothetical protein [Paracoccus sp. SY]